MNDVDIPEFVDCLPQFLFWEADEIAPAIVLLGLGILTNTLTYMIIPIYLITKFFTRFKANHLDGYFHHLMYSWGLGILNKRFTNAFIYEWHE